MHLIQQQRWLGDLVQRALRHHPEVVKTLEAIAALADAAVVLRLAPAVEAAAVAAEIGHLSCLWSAGLAAGFDLCRQELVEKWIAAQQDPLASGMY